VAIQLALLRALTKARGDRCRPWSGGEPRHLAHAGDPSGLGHDHIEIGFSDGAGNPLNHHGAQAWTPSGKAMRLVLIALSAQLGIHNS
jgi:hypothetical protein